jgi:hypothetical protein
MLVRAECVRQRNEVAIKLGIIFSSLLLLFPSSAKSLGDPPYPPHYHIFGGTRGVN